MSIDSKLRLFMMKSAIEHDDRGFYDLSKFTSEDYDDLEQGLVGDHALKMIAKRHRKVYDSLDPDLRELLRIYKSSSISRHFNPLDRSNSHEFENERQAHDDFLNSVKISTKKPVFRGIAAGESVPDYEVGGTYNLRAPTSTTFFPRRAMGFTNASPKGRILLQLRLPKNQRGFLYHDFIEPELRLPRNTHIEVHSIGSIRHPNGTDTFKHVKASVIPRPIDDRKVVLASTTVIANSLVDAVNHDVRLIESYLDFWQVAHDDITTAFEGDTAVISFTTYGHVGLGTMQWDLDGGIRVYGYTTVSGLDWVWNPVEGNDVIIKLTYAQRWMC